MMRRCLLRAFCHISFVACALAAHAEPLPAGSSQRTISVGDERVELHSYKPLQHDGGPILLVLHGLVRDQRAAGDFQVEPETQWTGRLFLDVIAAVRAAEARPDLAYLMLGHSAGAQALEALSGN